MISQVFTLQHANKMLPLVKSIIGDIKATWDKISNIRNRLFELENDTSGRSTPADRQAVKDELNGLIEVINKYIGEIENLGCFVEEFKRGIVNFPSMFRGRKVFLCWQDGDKAIDHWHEIDEAINERRPVMSGIYEDEVRSFPKGEEIGGRLDMEM